MKRIRTALSDIWDGVKLFAIIVLMIAGMYELLINAPVYCRYLTADIAAEVIGIIVTAVGICIVLAVTAAVTRRIRRERRSSIRYHKRNLSDRNRRCLGYPDAESVCRAVRRSYR